MTDSDVSLAKKRLARELIILAIVQVVALCIAGLGLFLFASKIVPNYPEWDAIHSLCGAAGMSGMVVSVVVAFWGSLKLTSITFLASLPLPIRAYVYGIVVYLAFLILVALSQCWIDSSILGILLVIFLLYCALPQFFIACWLAKETKGDTMESV